MSFSSATVIRGATAGLIAGLSALVADYAFGYVFVGHPLPPAEVGSWPYFALGGAGALLSGLMYLLARWATRFDRPLDLGLWSGLAVSAIYALPIAERLYGLAAVRLGWGAKEEASVTLAIASALPALLGLGLLIGALSRRLPVPAAAWLAGMAASLGLSINRNVVNHPLDTEALVADAAVLVLILVLAEVLRRRGAKTFAGLVAALLLATVAFTEFNARRAPAAERSAQRPDGTPPPHLILIVADTLRADVFRSVVAKTPEGRAFGEHFNDAVWFDRAQAAAPWTAPSMASILTGLYPAEHGFGVLTEERDPNRTLRPLASRVPTLASRLTRRGYLSEAVLANPILFRGSGIDRGFSRYEILDSTTKKLPPISALARLLGSEIDAYQDASLVNRRLRRNLPRLLNAERPIFLWLQYLDPHEPIRRHPQLPPDPSAGGLDEEQRLYRDEVRFTLLHLDRAIRDLKEAGIWQNSVTLFVSDHGEMHTADGHRTPVRDDDGNFLRKGHGKALYNSLTQIPLIIRTPDALPAKRRIQALVSHTDLHDTVVELLGVDVPLIGRDRISLAPYFESMTSKPPERRRWTLLGGIQAGIPQRGLVTESHKLILYNRFKEPELYQLRRDPGETTNITRYPRFDWSPFELQLEAHWDNLNQREMSAGDDAALDEETRSRLESLGYLQ